MVALYWCEFFLYLLVIEYWHDNLQIMKKGFIKSMIVFLIFALSMNVAKAQEFVSPTKPAETGKAHLFGLTQCYCHTIAKYFDVIGHF
jgi:hypothetical protein